MDRDLNAAKYIPRLGSVEAGFGRHARTLACAAGSCWPLPRRGISHVSLKQEPSTLSVGEGVSKSLYLRAQSAYATNGGRESRGAG